MLKRYKNFPLVDTIFILVIFLTAFNTFSKCFDVKVDLNGDNIYYYSLGQALHEDKGFVNIIGGNYTPHQHYPIGYPWIISQAMNFSTEIEDIKKVNGAFFIIGLILCYFLFKKLSNSKYIAFACCFLAAFNAPMLDFATMMMSEMSFFLITTLSLLLICYIKKDDKLLYLNSGTKKWKSLNIRQLILIFTVSILCVFSSHIRSIGIAFSIAAILSFLIQSFQKNETLLPFKFQRKFSKTYIFTAILIILFFFGAKLSWNNYMTNIGAETTKISYFSQLHSKTGGGNMQTADDWKERLSTNLKTYIPNTIIQATIFPNIKTTNETQTKHWIGGGIMLALIVLGIVRAKKCAYLLLFYLGATMVMLLLWPQQWGSSRFIIAIIPLLIFLFIFGIYEFIIIVFNKLTKTDKYNKYIAIGMALCFVVFFPKNLNAEIKKLEKIAKQKTYTTFNASPNFIDYKTICEYSAQTIADSSTIICRKPEIAYIFTKRTNFKSFPYHANVDEIFDYLVKQKAKYVIIDAWFGHGYKTIYPAAFGKYKSHFNVIRVSNVNPKSQTPCILLSFKP